MEEKRYFISDASKLLQVESHVLRYWEEELELVVPRTEMGHRYYTDEFIEVLKKVKELKEKGVQLKAIKRFLPELFEGKSVNQIDFVEIAADSDRMRGMDWQEQLQITVGRAVERTLEDMSMVMVDQIVDLVLERVHYELKEMNEKKEPEEAMDKSQAVVTSHISLAKGKRKSKFFRKRKLHYQRIYE